MVEVKEGQVWRDNDPRCTRFIRVTCVTPGVIYHATCNEDGGDDAGRRTASLPSRFQKRGRAGFTFIKNAE